MKRPFSSYDAKKLINEHEARHNLVIAYKKANKLSFEEVKESTDNLQQKRVKRVLKDIPIDELNRNKNGFRLKLLKDGGYETLYDLKGVSANSLSYIKGISQSSAYSIEQVAKSIIQNVKDTTKIRLSLDNKTKSATRVVIAVAKNRALDSLMSKAESIIERYKNEILPYEKDLKPGTNIIRWFFSSNAKKEKSINAYEKLTDYLNNDYEDLLKSFKDDVEHAINIDETSAWDKFATESIQFYNTIEKINPNVIGKSDELYGLPEELAKEIDDQCYFPDGLLCELRGYQTWGVKYILHQEKVLLGDEMGLGKTIQAIATMVSLKNTGETHFIVVCPASVITNWCREIEKMSRLHVTKVHGADRIQALSHWKSAGGVAVTTYETTSVIKLNPTDHFGLLVVDEAHYVKNISANRTKNVLEIAKHADRLLFMTGTALENKVSEMIALINMLQPNIARSVHGMESLASAPQFRLAVAPVYYRRKREDVLSELPDLIESEEWCTLSGEEESAYENAVLNKRYADARRVSWNVRDLSKSSKANRMKEIIDDAKDDGRKVIIFSFFLDTINGIYNMNGINCVPPINGSVPPEQRQHIIDEFDKAPAGTVLPAQIQSGGTGLNIQSASVVIICEPQFKPSIENQAISRAYRMGQTRNVLVYRLLCENTVDERLNKVLATKQGLFDAFADKSVAAAKETAIDDSKFGSIINEEIARIKAKNNMTN